MKFTKDSKILVVGGAGFIGSCLSRQLIQRGYNKVFVFDNFSTGLRDSIPSGCVVIEGDLRKKDDLAMLPKDIDCVIHLAAASSVEESLLKPGFYLENNVIGTINLLGWISKTRVKKLVFASSSAVYGDVEESIIMREDLVPMPVNYYALTKLDGEHLARMWNRNFGLDFSILRYFNVFGSGQDCISSYASVIPKFIYAAMRGENLTVYGTGAQTRDFIHVEEVSEATAIVMEKGAQEIYNVASGEQYDINGIAQLILKNIKTKSRVVYLPPVPGDCLRDNACNKKLMKLGWARKYVFEYWLEKTINWYQGFIEAKNFKRQ